MPITGETITTIRTGETITRTTTGVRDERGKRILTSDERVEEVKINNDYWYILIAYSEITGSTTYSSKMKNFGRTRTDLFVNDNTDGITPFRLSGSGSQLTVLKWRGALQEPPVALPRRYSTGATEIIDRIMINEEIASVLSAATVDNSGI